MANDYPCAIARPFGESRDQRIGGYSLQQSFSDDSPSSGNEIRRHSRSSDTRNRSRERHHWLRHRDHAERHADQEQAVLCDLLNYTHRAVVSSPESKLVDIARALGTSHTTIYRHFRSRADVFDAIVGEAMQDEEELARTFVDSEGAASERLSAGTAQAKA